MSVQSSVGDMSESINREAIALSLVVLITASVAAGVAWWRWERIAYVAGDIPLPPRSEITRSDAEKADDGEPGPCKFYIRHPGSSEEIRGFYLGEMAPEGWAVEENDEHRMRLRKGKRIVRMLIRAQKKATSLTIHVNPCG